MISYYNIAYDFCNIRRGSRKYCAFFFCLHIRANRGSSPDAPPLNPHMNILYLKLYEIFDEEYNNRSKLCKTGNKEVFSLSM